jgi:amino acid permease
VNQSIVPRPQLAFRMVIKDVLPHYPQGKSPMNGKMPEEDLSKLESCQDGQNFEFSEHAGTKRNIKSRHAQMIAIGGSIGMFIRSN